MNKPLTFNQAFKVWKKAQGDLKALDRSPGELQANPSNQTPAACRCLC
jgi:hypothetical protein